MKRGRIAGNFVGIGVNSGAIGMGRRRITQDSEEDAARAEGAPMENVTAEGDSGRIEEDSGRIE